MAQPTNLANLISPTAGIGGSRYATPGSAPTPDSNTTINSSGTTSNSGTTTGNTVNNTSSNSTQTTLDGANLAALNKFIQELMAGGTPGMRQSAAQRQSEINTVGGIRSGYSKGAAFTDAAGLMAQQSRKALESMLPSISRAAEDAGSSGGALRALLMQDAGNKAAESASALGAKQAVDYGNISANLSSVLEKLTQTDPVLGQLLISALGVAKGATTTTNTNTTSDTATTGTTNTNGTTTENKTANVDYAPFNVTSSPGRSTTPIYFGPSAPDAQPGAGVGSTNDFLNQLYGGNQAWDNYTF
jgi:hypothetical protein